MTAAVLPTELDRLLPALGLAAARAVPIAWATPALGGPHVPAHLRVGIGLALAALALPRLVGQVPPVGGALLALLVAREVGVGLTLGFAAAALFRAAEAAGRLADTLRGASIAEVLSPVTEERTSPLGDLFLLVAVVVFLELGGLGHLAAALGRSYEAVPIGGPVTSVELGRAAAVAVAASAGLLEAAVGLAAPVIVTALLVDIVLGALGRLVPQLPVYFVGLPLKALAGVGAVLVSLGAVRAAIERGLGGWVRLVEQAIQAWR